MVLNIHFCKTFTLIFVQSAKIALLEVNVYKSERSRTKQKITGKKANIFKIAEEFVNIRKT